MERLTYRDARGEAWYSDKGTEADRLHFIADIEDIMGDDYDLDRMRELVEADRDGRCVVLPCMVEAMPDVLMRDSVTYRNAVRFGLVTPSKHQVKFNFEQIKQPAEED